MNIVVCVKYVPDSTSDRRFEDDNTVDRVGVDGLLSELDEHAIEQALQLKESGAFEEVIVLTMGPEAASEAIRKSLQMGADKGVHVVDDAIAGSDALATSLVLAEAIKKTDHDLVICGLGSTDSGMGVIPAMLSERLGVPQLTFGDSISVSGSTVTIKRDSDASADTIEAELPLIASVTDRTGEARYPSFKGIMAAKKKEVVSWSLADLGIDPAQVGLSAAWTAVEAVEPRPPRTKGEIVTDDGGSGAAALVEFLAAKKFI